MTAPQIVSIEPDDSGALMWLVDDPEITGIGGTKHISDYKADEIQYARIAAFKSSDADKYTAAATEYMMSKDKGAWAQSDVIYLNVADYTGGKWVVSEYDSVWLDTDTGVDGIDAPTAYASLSSLGVSMRTIALRLNWATGRVIRRMNGS